MKAYKKSAPSVFKPMSITVEIETEEEFDSLMTMFKMIMTIPQLLESRGEFIDTKGSEDVLTKCMTELYSVLNSR